MQGNSNLIDEDYHTNHIMYPSRLQHRKLNNIYECYYTVHFICYICTIAYLSAPWNSAVENQHQTPAAHYYP